jgi:hypothetical protein
MTKHDCNDWISSNAKSQATPPHFSMHTKRIENERVFPEFAIKSKLPAKLFASPVFKTVFKKIGWR